MLSNFSKPIPYSRQAKIPMTKTILSNRGHFLALLGLKTNIEASRGLIKAPWASEILRNASPNDTKKNIKNCFRHW